jgi:membrane protease YdiL (CAAX protease family)
VCNVLVGVGIGFCLGFTRGATGQSVEDVPEQIEAFVSSPGGMLLFLFVGQAVFALVLWLATLRQRGARRIWLGMLPARISRSEYPLLVLGTLPVAWFGVILAGLVAQLYTPDDSMTGIWSSISPAMAVVFVLTLSIVPGLVEELFFRGHIQRRLLLRWPPACAIAVQPCCLRSLTWT